MYIYLHCSRYVKFNLSICDNSDNIYDIFVYYKLHYHCRNINY